MQFDQTWLQNLVAIAPTVVGLIVVLAIIRSYRMRSAKNRPSEHPGGPSCLPDNEATIGSAGKAERHASQYPLSKE